MATGLMICLFLILMAWMGWKQIHLTNLITIVRTKWKDLKAIVTK